MAASLNGLIGASVLENAEKAHKPGQEVAPTHPQVMMDLIAQSHWRKLHLVIPELNVVVRQTFVLYLVFFWQNVYCPYCCSVMAW